MGMTLGHPFPTRLMTIIGPLILQMALPQSHYLVPFLHGWHTPPFWEYEPS